MPYSLTMEITVLLSAYYASCIIRITQSTFECSFIRIQLSSFGPYYTLTWVSQYTVATADMYRYLLLHGQNVVICFLAHSNIIYYHFPI